MIAGRPCLRRFLKYTGSHQRRFQEVEERLWIEERPSPWRAANISNKQPRTIEPKKRSYRTRGLPTRMDCCKRKIGKNFENRMISTRDGRAKDPRLCTTSLHLGVRQGRKKNYGRIKMHIASHMSGHYRQTLSWTYIYNNWKRSKPTLSVYAKLGEHALSQRGRQAVKKFCWEKDPTMCPEQVESVSL
ncbi:hypothetical protein OSTOST_00443 [Ostertagia ostertagi]